MLNSQKDALFLHNLTTFADETSNPIYMTREYARVTVAMPENEEKQPVRQALDLGRFACKELAYEIENRDFNDE